MHNLEVEQKRGASAPAYHRRKIRGSANGYPKYSNTSLTCRPAYDQL
jgi:hypothetical protein